MIFSLQCKIVKTIKNQNLFMSLLFSTSFFLGIDGLIFLIYNLAFYIISIFFHLNIAERFNRIQAEHLRKQPHQNQENTRDA